jgi:hypothetical protein
MEKSFLKKKCPTSSNKQKPLWKVAIEQKIIKWKNENIEIMKNEMKQEQEKNWNFLEYIY